MVGFVAAPSGGISGLERSPFPPYDRPMEPSAGSSSEEVSWTPDGRFVISGSSSLPFSSLSRLTSPCSRKKGAIDGKIHIWDVAPPEGAQTAPRPPPGPQCTLYPIKTREAHLGGPCRVVAFNPKTAMMATAGKELVRLCLFFFREGTRY